MRCTFALGLLLLAAAAPAAERSFEITVAAGKHDRSNVPVCVPVDLPPELAHGSAVVRDPAGKMLPGQVTAPALLADPATKHSLCFILPALKAGDSVTLRATVSTDKVSGDVFSWEE